MNIKMEQGRNNGPVGGWAMRGVRGGRRAAYWVVAGAFGCALLFAMGTPGATQESVNLRIEVSPDTELPQSQVVTAPSWIRRLQERIAPPTDNITIPLKPFPTNLRGTLQDGRPQRPEPVKEPAHEIPSKKTNDPIDTQFASAELPDEVTITPPVSFGPAVVPGRAAEEIPLRLPNSPLLAQVASAERPKPISITPERRPLTARAVANSATRVAQRLQTNLSRSLLANFDLFLYVSKADRGPIAQRMYVFTKGDAPKSGLTLLHSWPVSTGREGTEYDRRGRRIWTGTPEGIYQLDPDRFYRRYTSVQWNQPMPNSMFFDWTRNGYRTGLAIHGVASEEEIAALGNRNSAGCVHLPPQAAEDLFNLVRSDYRGAVPRFAYNTKTKTMSNTGKLALDRRGAPRMEDGYRVLVVIENYGGEDAVSELYATPSEPNG
jgi:hypothetical protein